MAKKHTPDSVEIVESSPATEPSPVYITKQEFEGKITCLTQKFLEHLDGIEERLLKLENPVIEFVPTPLNSLGLSALPSPTGKISVKKNPVTLHYALQQEYSDGTVLPFVPEKEFKSIDEARNYFEYYKKALKENPAALGNLNDA